MFLSRHRSKIHQNGFYQPIAILILAAITLSVAIIFYLNSNVLFKNQENVQPSAASPSPLVAPSTSTSEPIQWKTYRNEEAKFQIKYPPTWELKFLDEWGNPDSTLVGKEGKIQFIWGEGLGGGCDREFENVTLKNGAVPSCHILDDKTESWAGFRPDNIGVDTHAYVNQPINSNREVILKILETYESIR